MTSPATQAPGAAASRFEALDGWRGVCACLVVLFHFHGYSPVYFSPLVRNSYLFVDFFFVLSGFVIAWNYASRLGTWSETCAASWCFGWAVCTRCMCSCCSASWPGKRRSW